MRCGPWRGDGARRRFQAIAGRTARSAAARAQPDGPVAVPQCGPVAQVPQQAEPDLFLRQGAAHDVAREVLVLPQGQQIGQVAEGDGRQDQAVGGQHPVVHIRPSCLKRASASPSRVR